MTINMTLFNESNNEVTIRQLTLSNTIMISYLTFVIVLSLVGNAITCYVIFRGRLLDSTTFSNYFIISLAVSDFLNGALKMPTTLLSLIDKTWWSPHYEICYFTTPLGVLFGSASVFNLCAVAVNRYFVIATPIQYPVRFKAKHAQTVIAIVWVASVCLSVPPIIWRSPDVICSSGSVSSQSHISEMSYFISLWVFVLILPALMMFVVYFYIFLYAKRQVNRLTKLVLSDQCQKARIKRRKEIRIAVILALVGGVFLVCWLPFFIVQTLHKFTSVRISSINFKVFLCLMYSNSALNPVLIIGLNQDIRKTFQRLILGRARYNYRMSLQEDISAVKCTRMTHREFSGSSCQGVGSSDQDNCCQDV